MENIMWITNEILNQSFKKLSRSVNEQSVPQLVTLTFHFIYFVFKTCIYMFTKNKYHEVVVSTTWSEGSGIINLCGLDGVLRFHKIHR